MSVFSDELEASAAQQHREWLDKSKKILNTENLLIGEADKEDFAASALREKHNKFLGGPTLPICCNNATSRPGKMEVPESEIVLGPDDFDLKTVIGKGAYGRVLQVVQKATGDIYALKVLQKAHVIKKNNINYVREERNILSNVDHPFVVSLKCAFETESKLYLLMEYMSGGELFHHLRIEGLFMEQTAAFYTAEIVLALEYLHSMKIIHRDLKPENVLLDSKGHVRITDFGLAKSNVVDEMRAKTICGTDLYMAPEMLGGNGYSYAVDWWSLGTLLFEMLTGDPPFFAKDTQKLYKKILTEKPKYPRWLSSACHSILKGLLERNVEMRLGAAKSTMFKTRGVQEVKSHKFFATIDWKKLIKKDVKAPFAPANAENLNDTSNFDTKFTSLPPRDTDEEFEGSQSKHLSKAPKDAFDGFTYIRPSFLEALLKPNKAVSVTPQSAQQESNVMESEALQTTATQQEPKTSIEMQVMEEMESPKSKIEGSGIRSEYVVMANADDTGDCKPGNKQGVVGKDLQVVSKDDEALAVDEFEKKMLNDSKLGDKTVADIVTTLCSNSSLQNQQPLFNSLGKYAEDSTGAIFDNCAHDDMKYTQTFSDSPKTALNPNAQEWLPPWLRT